MMDTGNRKPLLTTLRVAQAVALPVFLAIAAVTAIMAVLRQVGGLSSASLLVWRLALAAAVALVAVIALAGAVLEERRRDRVALIRRHIRKWVNSARQSAEVDEQDSAVTWITQDLKGLLGAEAVCLWEGVPGESLGLLAQSGKTDSREDDGGSAPAEGRQMAEQIGRLLQTFEPPGILDHPSETTLPSMPGAHVYAFPLMSRTWGVHGALTIHSRRRLATRSTAWTSTAALLPDMAEGLDARREAAERAAEGEIALRLVGESGRAAGLANALGCLCQWAGWRAAEIGLCDQSPNGFRQVARWHVDSQGVTRWMARGEASQNPPINLPDGPEMSWQEDLSLLFESDRSRAAAECGITAALVLPLSAGDRQLGTILAYGSSATRPAPAFRARLSEIGRWFGEALFRWRALEVVRLQERRLDEFVEEASIGLSEIASSGEIVWASPAQARLLGCSVNELVGRHVAEFMAEPAQVTALLQAIREETRSTSLDARMLSADGRLWHARIGIVGFSGRDGERGARCTIVDVTGDRAREEELRRTNTDLEQRAGELAQELKRLNNELLKQTELRVQAESELGRREMRFRALIEQAPGILLVLNGEGRIEFVSPGVETRLGKPAGAVLGESLFDLVHPDDLVTTTAGFQRLIERPGVSDRLEFRLRDAQGHWHEYAAEGNSRLDDPGVHGVVMTLRSESERKRNETALRESEERFRLLVEGVEDYAIYLVDPEGRVVSWNAGAARIKGYAAKEVLGKHYSLFYAPEDIRQGEPSRHLEIARREGRLQTQGWRLRKDGTRFWAEALITPLYDADRNLQGFAKVTRDITALREAGEQLRRRESQMAAAQQIARTGSWEWDVPTNQMAWSEEMCRIYGVPSPASSAMFDDYLDRTLPEDRDRVRQALERCRTDRSPFEYERRIRLADGSVRILLTRGNVEADEQGEVARVIGADQDITERKQMEDIVHTQRELYLSLLSAQSDLGEGVLLIDGDQVGYTNPALDAFFGLDAEARRSLAALLDRIDPARTSRLRHELDARRAEALPPARGQIAFRRADGSDLELEYTIKTASIDDRVRSFVLVRDVTERHRAETELRASREQLRAFSSELSRVREEESSRIAREIHDELGQRLTGLKMDAAWLASRLQALGPEAADHLAAKTRAMSELVDDTIREVRRIATELRPGILDDLGLTAALEWQADEFQQRTGIHCTVQVPAEIPGITRDQSTALFRICQEALTNVARHAQARNVEVGLAEKDDAIWLTVRDDGKGISDREARGASLGLMGMDERARLLGGEARVERAKPAGTIVQARLPRQPYNQEPR